MDLSYRSNLNRSLSAPDICFNASKGGTILRRVYMEEYTINDNTQVRQMGYQQLLGSDKHLPTRHLTPTVKYSEYFDKSKSMNCLSRINMDDSPMDIDDDEVFNASNNSEVAIDSPPPQSSTPYVLNDCKLSYRGRVPILTKENKTSGGAAKEVPVPSQKSKRSSIYLITITLFLAILGIPYYDKYYYNRNIDFIDLNNDLMKHVINQNTAIANIIDVLTYSKSSTLTIMSFIGATGVGKTYCASFIKRNYKPSQVYDIDISQYDKNQLSLHRNVPYLLLLDNLKITDIDKVTTILDTIPMNKSVIAITIFNIQDTQDHIVYKTNTNLFIEIPEKFQSTKYKTHPVIFNQITSDVVREHINIITNENDKVHTDEINALISEHNFQTFGFKGFYAKLALLVKNKLLTN